ncbi:MAG: hypothetical protein NZ518_00190 [Dehalococcoidia bacterium]|nr:hypothetical protein [Dehalococcoidia bacterium]
MTVVRYHVTLNEPVLATALDGDPNSAVSHRYLPGSMLRGLAIGLTLQDEKRRELDVNDAETRRRFFDGATRFLNGYPVIAGRRSLPAPRSWQKDSHGDGTAIADQAAPPGTPRPEMKKAKAIKDTYFVPADSSGEVILAKPARVVTVHTQRDRAMGRATEGGGAVFRYEALAAGQTFAAWIVCDDQGDAERFAELLKRHPTARLGGARTAGYGAIAIHDVAVVADADAIEAGAARQLRADGALTVTLLSDAILRDQHGQARPDAALLAEQVATRLGVSATDFTAFTATGMVGGFNRTWGLPLPQTPTLAAGSVIVLQGVASAPPEAIAALEREGIGERRAEGFGRLAINLPSPTAIAKAPEPPPPAAPTLSDESRAQWAAMQRRIEQARREVQRLEEAQRKRLSNVPPRSQISRVREVILAQIIAESPRVEAITGFLDDVKGKRAGKLLERAKVDGKSMVEWLREEANALTTRKVEDPREVLRDIDAVLVMMAKQNQQEGDER